MKTNYHTHSLFCDGTENPEQIVKEAISKGFSCLGFSGHSLFPFGTDWHIAPNDFHKYVQEIRRVQDLYKDKIEILCGFEADYLPPFSLPKKDLYKEFKPDYLIGSVHYLSNEKGWFTVDGSVEEVEHGLKSLYNGNGKRLVQDYFSRQRDMLQTCDFDIIAHIDVVKRRNDILHFFDEQDLWYKTEIKATAKAIAKAGVIAEINTGGIARLSIKDTYPSSEFLRMLHQHNVPITINSDAHCSKDLDCAFDFAIQKAKDAGYQEMVCLRRNGLSVEKFFVSFKEIL